MQHLFLDTNIVIDFLADRIPHSVEAAKLFTLAEKGKVKLYVATVSFNNIYYILNQHLTHQQTINLLFELSTMVELVDTTKAIIQKSLVSHFKDFEDSIQYYCAKSQSRISIIVSRNAKDFKHSELPVLSAKETLSHIINS